MSTIFNGDSQMEVITVLANCGTDIGRARQAVIRYITRKQEKGRSTEHILSKLRRLELKYINDTSLHPAFRDARAFTFLPRSPDLPLPDFVRKRNRRDGLVSRSELTITTNPLPDALPTSKSCTQLQMPSSPVDSIDSSVMGDIRIQPEAQGSRMAYSMLPRPPSVPLASASRAAIRSPYIHHSNSSRSRAFTLPPSMPPPSILASSSTTKKLRSSYSSSPPTDPLPDVPTDATDDDAPTLGLRLRTPNRNRHISWSSQSSSSSISSYPSPHTPGTHSPYPGLVSKSTAIRGDDHPPQRDPKTTGRPPVVAELSETDIPSMLFDREDMSRHTPDSDLPGAYRDSPILGERPMSRGFSSSLDNALRGCGASLVVRREVSRCIQQDRGYERPTWLTVLHECGIAEEDIPTLLREMAREAGFPSRE